jgi:hypothetical protein
MFGGYEPAQSPRDNSWLFWQMRGIGGDIRVDADSPSQFGDSRDEFGHKRVLPILPSYLYVFRAERMNVGPVPAGTKARLNPDASNLAEVLLTLQARPSQVQKYIELVRQVFPYIAQVSASPEGNGSHVRVLVWPEGSDPDRIDLAIPITDSGTGVSQVLSILYVALTSEYPQVIVIDEPRSFLHRGACRALMHILRTRFSQHQFIIATHSPTVITALGPSAMFIVGQESGESSVQRLDPKAIEDQKRVLSDVGATLGDVYGAEYVFWVEGPTESECFPLIANKLLGGCSPGIVFRPLRATGDPHGKRGTLVFEIYEN